MNRSREAVGSMSLDEVQIRLSRLLESPEHAELKQRVTEMVEDPEIAEIIRRYYSADNETRQFFMRVVAQLIKDDSISDAELKFKSCS